MINYEELKQAIRNMNRQQKLYKLLRDELSMQGHWKAIPRGNPKKAGKVSVAKRFEGHNSKFE